MSPHIIVDFNPSGLSNSEWTDAFDETLHLLEHWPVPLMSKDEQVINHIRVSCFSKDLRQQNQQVWSIIGDYHSRLTGEGQLLRRQLAYYKRHLIEPLKIKDLLTYVAQQSSYSGGPVRLINCHTHKRPYHYALLAVAMLLEYHFPANIMVWGQINPIDATMAQHHAESILGYALPLPIRTHAQRLYNRLSQISTGQTRFYRFLKLYLDTPNQVFSALVQLFDPTLVLDYWQTQLKRAGYARSPQAINLLTLWLNNGLTFAEATRIACSSVVGPQFKPEEWLDTLVLTGALLPTALRSSYLQSIQTSILCPSSSPQNFYHNALTGTQPFGVRLTLPLIIIKETLKRYYTSSVSELMGYLECKNLQLETNLRSEIDRLQRNPPPHPCGTIETLLSGTATSLAPHLIVGIKIVAIRTQASLMELNSDPTVRLILQDVEGVRSLLLNNLAKLGPCLTEDTLHRIAYENDLQTLIWLLALSRITVRDRNTYIIRTALFENTHLLDESRTLGQSFPLTALEEAIITPPSAKHV